MTQEKLPHRKELCLQSEALFSWKARLFSMYALRRTFLSSPVSENKQKISLVKTHIDKAGTL